MISQGVRTNGSYLGHVGWKYYNQIREKAMEREFSWSGLWLSLSIAFFIVFATAQALSMVYESVNRIQDRTDISPAMVYQLEDAGRGADNKEIFEAGKAPIILTESFKDNRTIDSNIINNKGDLNRTA